MPTEYVTKDDPATRVQQQTALVQVNPGRIVGEAMERNAGMVGDLLRQFAPTVQAHPADAHSTPEATITDDRGRSARYKLTQWVIVIICGIVAAGLGVLAYRTVADGVIAVGLFFVLWGSTALYFSHKAQLTDAEHSPEGAALVAARAAGFATETDAESRQLLARAFATSIEVDSAARADVARMQAADRQAALMAETTRVQLTAQRQLVARQAPHMGDQDGDPEVATPVITHVDTYTPAVEPITPGVQPHVSAVLKFVCQCYQKGADGQFVNMDRQGYITGMRAPWARRGELSDTDKEAAVALLTQIQPWLLAYDDKRRQWQINLSEPLYRKEAFAVRAVQQVVQ